MSYEVHGAEFEKPGEACGVFGVYAPDMPVASMAYKGLLALQHRGQEGAGIGLSDGEHMTIVSELGRVHDAFNRGRALDGLHEGFQIATGHTRYGTSGTTETHKRRALQPMYAGGETHTFSIAHNGHVDDLDSVADSYGVNTSGASSDTEIMKDIISVAYREKDNMRDGLREVLPQFLGAYSLVLATKNRMYAARDPHGLRPLHIGTLKDDGGIIVASEIAAIDIVKGTPVREVKPGELLVIGGSSLDDMESVEFAKPEPATCAFEFVYFSRPDNEMHGETVLGTRERMGQLLAEGDNLRADVVIGVPNSGILAADGYSHASGIPHKRLLVRNEAIDRTFITEGQDARIEAVHNKLNPIRSEIKGKRVVIVDDSIVRGTTTKVLVDMLFDAGAEEVHLRISSPPYTDPCYSGMDTGRKSELIAANQTVEEIRQYTGANSLKYLTNEQLTQAVGLAAGKICTACTTGVYPSKVSIRSRVPAVV